MKNILITGGAGFIGSHLAEFLLKKNYNITVFDRYNSNNDWGHLENSKFKKDIKVILPYLDNNSRISISTNSNNSSSSTWSTLFM